MVTPALSVVVPMYDEAAVLPLLVERLRTALDGIPLDGIALNGTVPDGMAGYEVLAVDDGSRDATPVLLERARRDWPQLRVVRLRANAGHQAALSAGLARARGAWVASLDADLQDPPEVLPQHAAGGAGRRGGRGLRGARRPQRRTRGSSGSPPAATTG